MLKRVKDMRRRLAKSTYGVFKLLMGREAFRTRIESRRIPGFLNKYVCYLYELWWRDTQTYDPGRYTEFQKRYWDTVGQYRWADSSTFDYSDITDNLTEYAASAIRLLELGCGKGDMLAAISRMLPNAHTVGIDASPTMCEWARKRSPSSVIICGYYGPDGVLADERFDIVIARSTLTYIDESDIERVLAWIASITSRVLIISEPSGIRDDQLGPSDLLSISPSVYKRLDDHTHIRDYARYPALGSFTPVKVENERFNAGGNRLWVFHRLQTPVQVSLMNRS